MNIKTLFITALSIVFITTLHAQEVNMVLERGVGEADGFRDDAEVIGSVENSILILDGEDLVLSNGLESGTKIVGNLGTNGRIIHGRALLNSKLYFIIDNDDEEFQLMELDPDSETLNTLLSGYNIISNIVAYDNKIYCSAESANSNDAFISIDPSDLSIQEIFELNSFGGMRDAVVHDDLIYTIHWTTTAANGAYLSRTNGTPGNVDEFHFFHNGSEFSQTADINMTSAGDNLYMWYNDGSHDYSLIVSDGTNAGTITLTDLLEPLPFDDFDRDRKIGILGNNILFLGRDRATNNRELWISDGTVEGTRKRRMSSGVRVNPQFFTSYMDQLYFYGASEDESFFDVCVSDGTFDGTNLLFDPSGLFFTGWHLVQHNDRLFFSAVNSSNKGDLYAHEGTEASLEMISDLAPGSNNSRLFNLHSAGENLFFLGDTGTQGIELYVYGSQMSDVIELNKATTLIYPNPAIDYLNLSNFELEIGSVIIYDINSQIVDKFLTTNEIVSIRDLLPGFYTLTFKNHKKTITSKFIKVSNY